MRKSNGNTSKPVTESQSAPSWDDTSHEEH